MKVRMSIRDTLDECDDMNKMYTIQIKKFLFWRTLKYSVTGQFGTEYFPALFTREQAISKINEIQKTIN